MLNQIILVLLLLLVEALISQSRFEKAIWYMVEKELIDQDTAQKIMAVVTQLFFIALVITLSVAAVLTALIHLWALIPVGIVMVYNTIKTTQSIKRLHKVVDSIIDDKV